MRSVRDFKVSADSVAVWWLGQSGFIFKTPEGTVIGVDLYLSDSCKRIYAEAPVDHSRNVPVYIEPDELDLDYFLSTHSHGDHADPDTISGVADKDKTVMIGSHSACRVFAEASIPEGRIRCLHAQETISTASFTVTGTYAVPTDASDQNHLGFLFRFRSGITFYVTGDTAWQELLAEAAPRDVDVMFVVVSPQFGALSFWDAAKLAAAVAPRVAVPTHYDMFPDNSVDPHQFEVALKIKAPETAYRRLEHFRPWVYVRGGELNEEIT